MCQIFNQSDTKPSQFWLGYLGFPIPWTVFLFLVRVMNGLLCYSFCYDMIGCSCHSDFGLTTLNCKVHLFGFDRWRVSKETVSDAVSVAGVASISLNEGLIQKNVSFKNSLQWPIDKINSVDKTKCYSPYWKWLHHAASNKSFPVTTVSNQWVTKNPFYSNFRFDAFLED